MFWNRPTPFPKDDDRVVECRAVDLRQVSLKVGQMLQLARSDSKKSFGCG